MESRGTEHFLKVVGFSALSMLSTVCSLDTFNPGDPSSREGLEFRILQCLISGCHLPRVSGQVESFRKISSTQGNFTGPLDDGDLFSVPAALGDLNGDGVPDLAMAAPSDDDGSSARGAVYILFMNADGTVLSQQKISSTTGGFTGPLAVNDLFGLHTSSIGDLDGDGIIDLAVGARLDDTGGNGRGAVYILFLNSDGTVKGEQKIAQGTGGLTAVLADVDGFGVSIAALGDIDGDGVQDLAVGASNDDNGGTDRGAVYILFMNTNGTVKSEQKISSTQGNFTGPLADNDAFGNAVAPAGDLDGDGIGDLMVNANEDAGGGTARGAVYLLMLNQNGTVKSEQKIGDFTNGFTGVLKDNDFFGSTIIAPGDLNGDGIPDFLIGADRDSDGGLNRGALYIIFRNLDGSVRGWNKISSTSGGFNAPLDNDDQFAFRGTLLGDLNGDGIPEPVVGTQFDDDGGTDRGAAYILFLERAR